MKGGDSDLRERLRTLRIERTPEAHAVPAPRTARRPLRSIAAFAGAAAAGAAAVLLFFADRPTAPPTAVAAPAPAAAPSASGSLIASGFIVPRRAATVGSQITGQLRSIQVAEGEHVAAGQIVAYLDSSLADSALAAARAQVRIASAGVAALNVQHGEALRVVARGEALKARGFVTVASLTANQAQAGMLAAQIAEASANVAAARAAADGASVAVGRHVIRAPFAGIVINKNAEVGEVISPVSAGGGFTRTGVITLVDMSSLGVEVDVNEAYISQVQPGQRADLNLDAYPGQSFDAVVAAIVPSADRNRATVRVRLDIAALDPRMLPQMAAKVTFHRAPSNRETPR
jgi:RND family efflux transporter MFP subunit